MTKTKVKNDGIIVHVHPVQVGQKKFSSNFFYVGFELITTFLEKNKKNYFTFYKGVHFHILIQCRRITPRETWVQSQVESYQRL